MTIATEPTDILLQRKQGLDNFLMMAVYTGVEVPTEMESELLELTSELEKRGVSDLAMYTLSCYIGSDVDGYVIEKPLSQSYNSYVYLATNRVTNDQCVVKIARAFRATPNMRESARPAYFVFRDDMFEATSPVCDDIVDRQVERLQALTTHGAVPVLASGLIGERSYYVMPFIQGQSLRELIDLGSIPLDIFLMRIFITLADMIDGMEKAGLRHGNITAEHVMVTKEGITLLSPGFHPAMLNEALNQEVIYTTPAYYPLVDADDLLACGILLYEAACKKHPLTTSQDGGEKELEGRASTQLRNLVENEVLLGNLNLCNLVRFQSPDEIEDSLTLKEGNEFFKIVMKVLGLNFDQQGLLVPQPNYNSAGELRDALLKL